MENEIENNEDKKGKQLQKELEDIDRDMKETDRLLIDAQQVLTELKNQVNNEKELSQEEEQKRN